ncbi:MAG: phosphoribosylglycinamide formyltransferase [Granulosicoccaceae bacterium]|jgi:phosphoribosylglycinamide formyltransferase-1
MSQPPLPVVILISGSGTNLQAIIDAWQADELPVEIRAVISNRPGVQGLQRAMQAGIETVVVDHTQFEGRAAFDQALQQTIDSYAPQLVILAGFMRILTHDFVEHYAGRMLNIHPALLPDFPGLNTHERALQAGVEEHGASVHFVTTEVDGGPIIIQGRVPVEQGDTPDSLAARVLQQEHRIYPEAIRLYAEGRIRMHNNQVLLDGKALPQKGIEYS